MRLSDDDVLKKKIKIKKKLFFEGGLAFVLMCLTARGYRLRLMLFVQSVQVFPFVVVGLCLATHPYAELSWCTEHFEKVLLAHVV